MEKIFWQEGFWQENHEMTGNILVTLKGKPIITTNMFKSQRQRIIESDSIWAQTYYMIDRNVWDRDMLELMINSRVEYEYMIDNNMKNIEITGFSLDSCVLTGKISVSDFESKSFYDEQALKGCGYDKPFEEVKHVIEALLKPEKWQKIYEKKIKELIEKYEIKVNEDYFKSVDGDIQEKE